MLISTKTDGVETLQETYGQKKYCYVGGEIDILKKGFICGGWLPGHKARLLI